LADNQDAIELKRRARRRLVGAIALVVFVVIALPIVLDSEPKPTVQNLTIQIPSQDSGKFATRVLPAQPDPVPTPTMPTTPQTPEVPEATIVPAPAPVAATKASPPAVPAAAKPAVVSEVPKASAAPTSTLPSPAQTAKAEAPVKDAPKVVSAVPKDMPTSAGNAAAPDVVAAEAKSPAAAERGFVVPLGLFSKADNIKQVRAKATAAGFKTYTETVAGSASVRVRAGPFTSRDAAEKAREKLKGAGLDVGAVAAR